MFFFIVGKIGKEFFGNGEFSYENIRFKMFIGCIN